MTARPELTAPVRFSTAGDELRATFTVATGVAELDVIARLTHDGRLLDLQAHGPKGAFFAGRIGDDATHQLVAAVIDTAYATARNAVVLGNLERHLYFRGKDRRR
jgi:hypothetical protein